MSNFRSFIVLDRQHFRAALTFTAFLFLIVPSLLNAQDTRPAVDLFNHAQDLHEKGDLKGAIELYGKALAVQPEFPEAEYQRGVAYISLGDLQSAETSLRRAIALRPDWRLAKTSLASVLIDTGSYGEALPILESVVRSHPEDERALTALVELRLRQGASPEILGELLARVSAAVALADSKLPLWTARAALESSLGKREMAKVSLLKASSIDPKNALVQVQLGEISLAEGDVETAREILKRLGLGQEKYGPAVMLKANLLARDGRYEEAIAALGPITGTYPAAVKLRQSLETAKLTSPYDLEKQLEKNPTDVALVGRLCSVYRRSDPAKSLTYCRKASEAEPNNIGHAVGFGAALVQAREYSSAVDLFRRIITIAPENSTARANLATALFQLKRYEEARSEFRWLANSQSGSAAPYYFLGIVHDQLGEYKDAVTNYQQFLRLADPTLNKTDIEKVNLRLPQLHRLIKDGKGKKSE